MKTVQWELREVTDSQWIQDESGVYTLINWRQKTADVRLDVMGIDGDVPIISFVGPTKAVRKEFCRWAQRIGLIVSLEHAAYIGAELSRASRQMENYIQE